MLKNTLGLHANTNYFNHNTQVEKQLIIFFFFWGGFNIQGYLTNQKLIRIFFIYVNQKLVVDY